MQDSFPQYFLIFTIMKIEGVIENYCILLVLDIHAVSICAPFTRPFKLQTI
jgi:hypothetical protein